MLLDRPPPHRAPEVLAEVRSIAAQAPENDVRTYLAAAPDQTGRRLDGRLLDRLLTASAEPVLCFAAQLYIESNPYRWADPEVAIGFATVRSRYQELTIQDQARRQPVLARRLVADHRLPWERPKPPGKLPPGRSRQARLP